MHTLGFPESQARSIEANYHTLYRVSDEWVQNRLIEASRIGYLELAFGLRLRTPLLAKTIMNTRQTPYEAKAEARTAGNALGQSYGLLNCRAMVAFMQLVWKSEYQEKILPICMIHDAIYLIIEDSPECILWTNKHLIQCMQWQDLPEIQHPQVKLEAEMELLPTWATPVKLNNHETLQSLLEKYRTSL